MDSGQHPGLGKRQTPGVETPNALLSKQSGIIEAVDENDGHRHQNKAGDEQQQEQKAQKQREQISILREFVTGYEDFSVVKPLSKQTILKFVKTFKPDVDQHSTKDELLELIKNERRRFLRNQSQIQRRQRLATIIPPSQQQLQQQQNLGRLHDYIKGFDHDSVLNPISKQTIVKFVRSFNKDVGQQLSRQQLIKLIDNQKKRLLQLQWQQQQQS